MAARILQQQDFAVEAAVISFSPAHRRAVEAAQKAAAELSIPLAVLHCEELFDKAVVSAFCATYAAGRTPNPCVVCNPLVKFKVLADEADRRGIRYIASGHYARTELKNGVHHIAVAASAARDQSYMLYRLPPEIRGRLCLPVGEFEKPAVRHMAEDMGLSCADAPDSQEICFIPDGDHAAFIAARGVASLPGRFLSPEGRDLGPHGGVAHYTVGQRKGLGIALGQPVFVKEILAGGDIRLGYAGEEYAAGVVLQDIVTAGGAPLATGEEYLVKIRSAAAPSPCKVRVESGQTSLLFQLPLRAAAPGQHAVLYCDGLVMGGGAIHSSF